MKQIFKKHFKFLANKANYKKQYQNPLLRFYFASKLALKYHILWKNWLSFEVNISEVANGNIHFGANKKF